ncbi:MAG: class I SAM-dependent methyltransferase [Planctomycetaceae bacterium]|nr:class I SAM-dependent methyltransferase [Planctomycetaceae bacterium]
MTTYRWNTSDFAIGYDAAADKIHPYYLEIQDAILARLPRELDRGGLVIDLGGGSGRLVERILDAWPRASAVVLDQSEPFLALAERRLAKFGSRATCVLARLQDDWKSQMSAPAVAIVSMSAIHHLEPAEKQTLYRQCAEALGPGGVLMNGDEVRDADDAKYLAEQQSWANHMRRGMADGSIGEVFHSAIHKWIDRNVTRFGEPKNSGDDCHETIQAQLDYFRAAGFAGADCPWQKGMWAVMRGNTNPKR